MDFILKYSIIKKKIMQMHKHDIMFGDANNMCWYKYCML